MKAILVVDMPKDCEDCVFGFDYRCYMTWKQFEEKEDEENGMVAYSIPKWCPLKPCPERMPQDMYVFESDALINAANSGYVRGWNDCVEVIDNEQNDRDIQKKEEE